MNVISIDKKIPMMDKVAMLLLAIYPINDYYMPPFGPFSYGQISIIIYIAYSIFFQKGNCFKYTKGFGALWIYTAITTMLLHGEIKVTNLIPGGISFCMFALSLGVFSKHFSYKYFKLFFRGISTISIAIFIAQEIMYVRTGVRFVAVIPFQMTNYADISYQELCVKQMYTLRSASIFMEPSYFAQYILITLCIELFDREEGKLFSPYSLLLMVTLVLTRSGSGAVGLGVILLYLFYSAKKQGRIKIANIMLLLPIVIGFIYYWISSESGSEIMSRSTEFGNEDTSGYMRSVRGFIIIGNLSFIGQLFGISLSDFSNIGQSIGVYSGTGMLVNGFQNAFIALGGIGLLFLFSYYYKLYVNTAFVGKASIIMLLLISLIEANYLSPSMLILTVIATAFHLTSLQNR